MDNDEFSLHGKIISHIFSVSQLYRRRSEQDRRDLQCQPGTDQFRAVLCEGYEEEPATRVSWNC